MINSWQDLEVWQKAHALTLKIYKISREFPGDEKFRLADQLRRSASSIPANIAEGKGRNSIKEYIQFLYQARGSLEETRYHLLLSRDLGYLPSGIHAELENEYAEVSRMLNGLIRSLKP